ncbi:MAG: PspC domain-containing protein [Acidobacteria bacterium]|nr:PspC domain-containing protein [Acidobacteriota bacterium]
MGANAKRLYKSRKNCVIDGVCGGIGEYLDVDPVLVRIVAVFFLFVGGSALIAYIVGMIIIPKAPIEAGETEENGGDRTVPVSERSEGFGKAGGLIFGVIMIAFGVHFLLRNIPFFHQYYWRFWDFGWHFFWPSVLILIGLLIIFKGSRK